MEKKIYQIRNLGALEERIGYNFKSLELLYTALRHPSVESASAHSYENFEFLGDRVLNFLIAKELFIAFPKDNEGSLSLKLNALVSGATIAKVAFDISLGEFIEMSQSEKASYGKSKKSNLENCMEALIGGIFLDSDINNAEKVVLKLWKKYFSDAEFAKKDPKTQLQEWLQAAGHQLPQYILVDRAGPDHDPIFHIKLITKILPEFQAHGASVKSAQTSAAKSAIEFIENNLEKI